ncbi:MAG: sulfur acceptor for SufS cysteine desulfurase [Candidatus Westeberhardia cardiocondylae]|nr:sulfur acceptor for SufS cysteine desulfurase [Candidatus Westeberhardia cardiocondylae]
MKFLPNKIKLLKNFSSCVNWEEKYFYIIELGENLPKAPKNIRIPKYLILGCQSRVWIMMTNKYNHVKLYGDSDALITKGLVSILIILYKGLTLKEIIDFEISSFLNILSLNKYLSKSRSQGLLSIIENIQLQAHNLINKKF